LWKPRIDAAAAMVTKKCRRRSIVPAAQRQEAGPKLTLPTSGRGYDPHLFISTSILPFSVTVTTAFCRVLDVQPICSCT
jgi:hypothetical protein